MGQGDGSSCHPPLRPVEGEPQRGFALIIRRNSTGSLGFLWGGGGSHPPWRNERPDEFEVGWSGAKVYGCRQDTDGPAAAAANRCR